jgi:glycosyltransferase involved in cell wall biosynthesis
MQKENNNKNVFINYKICKLIFDMRINIIIPAYNEEENIGETLHSLINQSIPVHKIIIINDNSTDGTQKIIDSFTTKFSNIVSKELISSNKHLPGSKVINAFYKGFDLVDKSYDIICKIDADLIFPLNYFEKIIELFKEDANIGMAGGFCYIKKNNNWILESLTNKDHIRGALKAYRKKCFTDIGGLKNTMGWDTVDELLARYHGWSIATDENLKVKHLKPTGANYSREAKHRQAEAFYKMRYGLLLFLIATIKLALKKKNFYFFINTCIGYLKASINKVPFMVTVEEGAFIRSYRWRGIKKAILLKGIKNL